jgi:hypothetical protein
MLAMSGRCGRYRAIVAVTVTGAHVNYTFPLVEGKSGFIMQRKKNQRRHGSKTSFLWATIDPCWLLLPD